MAKQTPAQLEKAADKILEEYFNQQDKATQAGVKADAPKPKRIPTALEGEEYFKIYESVDKLDNLSPMQKLRLRTAMEIGYGGGLRVSEIMNLRRENISITSDGQVILDFIGAKTKEPAQVILPPRSSQLVVEVLESAPSTGGKQPLFPAEARGKSEVLSGATFNTRMKAAAAEAGFSPKYIDTVVSAHNLRHGFVTSLISGGAALSEVQKAARHVDPKTTLGYSHVKGAAVKNIINNIHPIGRIGKQSTETIVPKNLNIDNLAKTFNEDKANLIKVAYSNFVSGASDDIAFRQALINSGLSNEIVDNLVTEASQTRSSLTVKPNIASFDAREAGALPGTNLVPEQGTMPKSKRGVGAPAGMPFRTNNEGLALVVKTMGDNKIPVDKALQRIGNSAKTFMFELESEIARGNNRAPQVLEAFKSELQRMFPDGLSFQGRFLVDILDDDGKVLAKAGSLASASEAEAISHALKNFGYLQPVDPEMKKAKEHLTALETKGNDKYQAPNSTERRELRAAVDAGGAAPFTHVEYKQDKAGNVIKVLHRNEIADESQRQPFFKVDEEPGFVLNEALYEEKRFPEKDIPEWAKRKPNSQYIEYFQYQERVKIAQKNAQAKPRGGMTAGEVQKHTQKVADANRVLGILQANPPERPPLNNAAGFEAASGYLLGEDYTPQQIPKAVAQPTTPALPDVERTPPVTKKEVEDYEKALGRKRGLRGFGKGLGRLGGGFLGIGLGAALSEDSKAGAIEGFFPPGFEPATVEAATLEDAEKRKARIRGLPSAMRQEEQDVFLEREALTEAQRRRETARMAMPPSERSMSFMDQ